MMSKYRTIFSGLIASNALIVRLIIGAKFLIDIVGSFPLVFFFLAVAGCFYHIFVFWKCPIFFFDYVIIFTRF